MAQADCGATTFGVHLGAWADPEVAAMVAPPVTVSSMPVSGMPVSGMPVSGMPVSGMPVERAMNPWRRGQLARSRGNMPVGKHRRPTR